MRSSLALHQREQSTRPVSSGETRLAARLSSPASCPDRLSRTSLNFAGTHAVTCHHSARSTLREWNASIGMLIPVVFLTVLVGAVAYRPSLPAIAPKIAGREGLGRRLCLHPLSPQEVADAMHSRLHCTSHCTAPTTKDPMIYTSDYGHCVSNFTIL